MGRGQTPLPPGVAHTAASRHDLRSQLNGGSGKSSRPDLRGQLNGGGGGVVADGDRREALLRAQIVAVESQHKSQAVLCAGSLGLG